MQKKVLFLSFISLCLFTILSCSYSTDFSSYNKNFTIYNYTSNKIKINITPSKFTVSSATSGFVSPINAGENSEENPVVISNTPGVYYDTGNGLFGIQESITYYFTFYNENNQAINTVSPNNSGISVNCSVTGNRNYDVSLIETFLPLSIPVEQYNTLVNKITDEEKRAYFEELYYHTPYETDYYKEELTECHMENQRPSDAYTVQDRSTYIRNAEKIADEYGLFPKKEQYFFAYHNER